jgi:hypothetical protein
MKKVNLFKFPSKFFCKKRMGVNREYLRELLRKHQAEEELRTDNSALLEAFHVQGALYHDTLFNSISIDYINP